MDRRTFLATSAALQAQVPAPTASPVPPPKKAKITSSVMLWTLKGSFEEKMEATARAGIQSVEMVGEHQNWTDADIDRIKKLARSLKLGMDTISSTPNWKRDTLNMVDPAQRPRLLKEVERHLVLAQKLEIPMALLMSGDALPNKTWDEQFQSCVDGAKACAEIAEKYNITLIVEPLNTKVNHKGYFLNSCVAGLELMKRVNHPNLRLLFDIYHEQVELGNVIRTMQAAMPFVKVFHVADNPGRNEPGTGEMNYDNIYKAIAKAGYEGYVTMEYLPTKDQVQSLTTAVNEMRKSLA